MAGDQREGALACHAVVLKPGHSIATVVAPPLVRAPAALGESIIKGSRHRDHTMFATANGRHYEPNAE